MNNKDPRKQKILRFTIHLIALCILFVLPEVMLSLNSHRPPHPMQWAFYLKALVFVGVSGSKTLFCSSQHSLCYR